MGAGPEAWSAGCRGSLPALGCRPGSAICKACRATLAAQAAAPGNCCPALALPGAQPALPHSLCVLPSARWRAADPPEGGPRAAGPRQPRRDVCQVSSWRAAGLSPRPRRCRVVACWLVFMEAGPPRAGPAVCRACGNAAVARPGSPAAFTQPCCACWQVHGCGGGQVHAEGTGPGRQPHRLLHGQHAAGGGAGPAGHRHQGGKPAVRSVPRRCSPELPGAPMPGAPMPGSAGRGHGRGQH